MGSPSAAEMRESTRRILRLCLITAQRVGEVSGMTIDELDLSAGLWTLPAERSKNKRGHVIPLSAMAVAIINDQIADTVELASRRKRRAPVWVFPGPGARAATGATGIAQAVQHVEWGMPRWTPHDLRRTAATGMESAGISPFVVGHVLNHVSATKATVTSRVYARYDYLKEKTDALNLWSEKIASLLGEAETIKKRDR
jgi:integrase